MSLKGTIQAKTGDGSGGGFVLWTAEEQKYSTYEDISSIDVNDKVTFTITSGGINPSASSVSE